MEGEGGGVHIQVRGTSELINYKNMGEEEVVKKPETNIQGGWHKNLIPEEEDGSGPNWQEEM